MHLPIYLTFIRVIMSPIFLIIYLYSPSFSLSPRLAPYLLLTVWGICELSDFLDGFLARLQNRVTSLGKILDPMADSIFRLSLFLSFTQGIVSLPVWIVLIFFLRDSMITALRTLCAFQGVVLAARLSGKIKAVFQATAALFILVAMIFYSRGSLPLSLFQSMSYLVALIAAIYTAISGVEYIVVNWKWISRLVHSSTEEHEPQQQ